MDTLQELEASDKKVKSSLRWMRRELVILVGIAAGGLLALVLLWWLR